jgi:DNA-binding MarR family transcriptional regulator
MRKKIIVPPLLDRISFLIHRVEAKTELVCNPLFRDMGLALQDTRVLVNLLEAGQLRVGDLVNIMAVPQSTISHQLRSLEKRKLLRRTPGVVDSRSVEIELTAHGREVAQRCNVLSEEVYRSMVEGLSSAELKLLRTQLRDVYRRLEEFGATKTAERLAQSGKQPRVRKVPHGQ